MSSRSALWMSIIAGAVALVCSLPLLGYSGPASNVAVEATIAANSIAKVKEANHTELLNKVLAANQDVYTTLESFLCSEKIERFRAKLTGDHSRQLDTLTADVAFENGAERYTALSQRGKSITAFSDVSGAWSEGEFATLLLQTQTLIRTQPVVIRDLTDQAGASLAVLSFQVDEEQSPWDLEVSGKHYRVPFRTDVTVSKDTGEIQRIARSSLELPAELRISELRWNVELGVVELANRSWLLPKAGEYDVVYNDFDRRDWNVLSFSNYRHFEVQASLRFD